MRQVNAQTIRQGFVEFVARQPPAEDAAGGTAESQTSPAAEMDTRTEGLAAVTPLSPARPTGGPPGARSYRDLPITETVLLRGGAFCGRRLQYGGWQLVWFMEERQVKLWRPDGELHACYDEQQFVGDQADAWPRAA
jgi:hypothetical protein